MSTPARYAQAAARPASEAPAASTALVARSSDGGPRLVPLKPEKPVNAHWFFYGMGYSGLALIWTALWLEGFVGQGVEVFYIVGGLFVALGGFGVFIHTLYKPNERKVRHMLLAIGSLALTLAASVAVERISREMYASAAADRLQPLAEALAKDVRIREIGHVGGRVTLNGYHGPAYGLGRVGREDVMLEEVLARDGISREQLLAYQRWLERVGMARAQRTASTVAFYPAGPRGPWLLYLLPGHALPPATALLPNSGTEQTHHSEPLGGPWYMVMADET